MPHAPCNTQYGKDFYYRAHPEDLKKFYAAVDEFHRAYDAVTEFESLNTLAAEMVPSEYNEQLADDDDKQLAVEMYAKYSSIGVLYIWGCQCVGTRVWAGCVSAA